MTLRNLAAIALALLMAVAIAGSFALSVVLPKLMSGGPR